MSKLDYSKVMDQFAFGPGRAIKRSESIEVNEDDVAFVGLAKLDGVSNWTGIDYSHQRSWMIGQLRRLGKQDGTYLYNKDLVPIEQLSDGKPTPIINAAAKVLNIARVVEGEFYVGMAIKLLNNKEGRRLRDLLESHNDQLQFTPVWKTTHVKGGQKTLTGVCGISWSIE